MELLEQKNTVSEIMNSRLNTTEGRIKELKN